MTDEKLSQMRTHSHPLDPSANPPTIRSQAHPNPGKNLNQQTEPNQSESIQRDSSQRESSQRLAIFGGTFDPPHRGHMAAAEAVLRECDVDKVLFVVAGQPWQKLATDSSATAPDSADALPDDVPQITPAQDRLAMVKAATHNHPQRDKFEVCELEIDRGGDSYTADTLEELARQHPEAELLLVIGSDLVSQLETWKRPEVIKQLASLVVVERPGHALPDHARQQLPEGWSGRNISGDLVDVSSTQIKEWIASGCPNTDLVPAAVVDVIAERELYGRAPAPAPPAPNSPTDPTSRNWAIAAARIADDKLGRGTVVIDVSQVVGITDFFVITNGGNQRQVKAIMEEIEQQIAAQGGPRPSRAEGKEDLSWVLMDYGDFVVHIFDPKARDYYDLERLWRDQPYLDWN